MLNLVTVNRFLRQAGFKQYLGDILMVYDFYRDKAAEPGFPVVLLKNGTVLTLVRVRGIDYENSGRDRIEGVIGAVKSLLEQLKPGVVLQTYLVRRRSGTVEDGWFSEPAADSPLLKFLAAERGRFYRKLGEQTFENEIFFSIKVNRGPAVLMSFRRFVAGDFRGEIFKDEIDRLVERLQEVVSLFRVTLRELGVEVLSREEIFRLLYFLVNFEAPVCGLRDDLSLHRQLLRSEITFQHDALFLDDRVAVGAVPLVDLPRRSYALMFEAFFRLKHPFILHQFLAPFDFNRLKNRFLSDKKFAESTAHKLRESRAWLDDYTGFTGSLSEGSRPLLYSFVLFNIAAEPEDLKSQHNEVINLLKSLNAYGVADTHYLRNTFFSYLPGHEMFSRRRFMILSDNAAHFLNVYRLERGDSRATELLLDRNAGLYRFNLLKPDRANHTAITGPTGSGKTFLTIRLLLSCLPRRPYVFVIDPKRSYYSLFETLQEIFPDETAVFKYADEAVDFQFNPFLPKKDGSFDEEQVKFSENLLSLMIGGTGLAASERSLLRQALETFYFEYANLVRNGQEEEPPVSLLHSILKQKKNCRELALGVKNWTCGERGYILNSGRDRLRFSRFCYFDLRDLENRRDVLKVISYILFHKIKGVIEDDRLLETFKILVLEEAAVYLKLEEFREITDYFIRTGRTSNLLLVPVSQSINDFLEFDTEGNIRPWSNSLLTNLVNIILFGGQKNVGKPFRVLDIGDEFSRKYQGLDTLKREFLLWQAGGLRRIFTCPVDRAGYWLATTRPQERARRSRVLERFHRDWIRALSYLVKHEE